MTPGRDSHFSRHQAFALVLDVDVTFSSLPGSKHLALVSTPFEALLLPALDKRSYLFIIDEGVERHNPWAFMHASVYFPRRTHDVRIVLPVFLVCGPAFEQGIQASRRPRRYRRVQSFPGAPDVSVRKVSITVEIVAALAAIDDHPSGILHATAPFCLGATDGVAIPAFHFRRRGLSGQHEFQRAATDGNREKVLFVRLGIHETLADAVAGDEKTVAGERVDGRRPPAAVQDRD
eukprot:CAMPEP_0194335588 /NCGR_PEP_ID=MMETSP0171-20130528/70050_1 /TAXON_ID=218684 /ORGANISM="Corethron pennatum, Strain L29A3" /LENGTH=233 /DNA_ID=CAMNT_0039098737 /DNA_START=746 /DNA_END=1446 /DNA_ORIENTATION=+